MAGGLPRRLRSSAGDRVPFAMTRQGAVRGEGAAGQTPALVTVDKAARRPVPSGAVGRTP